MVTSAIFFTSVKEEIEWQINDHSIGRAFSLSLCRYKNVAKHKNSRAAFIKNDKEMSNIEF